MVFRRNRPLKTLIYLCDAMHDFAPFTQPEVVAAQGGQKALRLMMLPGVYSLFYFADDRCYSQQIRLDEETGEPSELQDLTPWPVSERGDPPKTVAASISIYLTQFLVSTVHNEEALLGDRQYAAEALRRIDARMNQGPPHPS